MTQDNRRYVLDTAIECTRLDRQVPIQGEETILRHIPPNPGSTLLDAGSGSGAPARLIARHHPGTQVIGADMNEAYCAYANRRADDEGLTNFKALVTDLTNLPFADNTVDMTWSQYVVYFIADPQAALREFARVTKPGGEVVIRLDERTMTLNEPEDPNIQPRVEILIDSILSGWRNKRLPGMFWEAGFTDVRVDVEYDGLYTIVGAATPQQRRNVAEVLDAPLMRYADRLGGSEAAAQFLVDWLSYLDRPDTFTATPAWIVRGRAPG